MDILPGGRAALHLQPPFAPVIDVDLTLQSHLVGLNPVTNRATRYAVFIDVTGPLAKPNLSVRSNPPGLTEGQALASLFGGAAYQSLAQGTSVPQLVQEQFGQVLLGLALPMLVPPLTLGPFVLSLSSGYDTPVDFTASVPLTSKLTIAYTSSVVGRTQYGGIDLGYTFTQHIALDAAFGGSYDTNKEAVLLLDYFTRY
jgi:hypothetical protein